MRFHLLAVAVVASLVMACQVPYDTKPPSAARTLNLSQPGKVLQQIALATGTVPATANGGRSLHESSARALFDPADEETVIQGSRLIQALANASVNITDVLMKGLQTSATATADDMTVGETVDVGAITLTMGTQEMPIADAGRLTTRLSDDGSELQYFWNLGAQLGAPAEIWFVLNVFADGSLELYAKTSDTSYMKSTSSPAGLVQFVQYSSGTVSAFIIDTQQSGTLRTASLNTTFKTILSASGTNAGVLTIQDLSGSPWYGFEAYDDGGNLLVTAGGSKTNSTGGTVNLDGDNYTQSKFYLLKALTPTDGYSWAREDNGIWYAWPNPAPSISWNGGMTDQSGAQDAIELTNYTFWLEAPGNDPDSLDAGDSSIAGYSQTTELSFHNDTSKYQGALAVSLSDQNVANTGHLAVSTAAQNTFSATWTRTLDDLADLSAFSGTEFLADFDTVMDLASELMPSLDN